MYPRKLCERCGDVDLTTRHWSTRFCQPCQSARFSDNGGSAAYKVVRRAIKRGELPDPKTLSCTDCGKQARDYDHRDYGKPLEVQAVCRSCNRKRGPARPVLTLELPITTTAYVVSPAGITHAAVQVRNLP